MSARPLVIEPDRTDEAVKHSLARAVARRAMLVAWEEQREETSPEEEHEKAAVADSGNEGFRLFLPHWHFINRESGAVCTFRNPSEPCRVCLPGKCQGTGLWPGQRDAVEVMLEHDWLYLLKAGKLGFTELECAWDAFVALFRTPNANVGLFSKEQKAARTLQRMVRFGLRRLPSWLSLPVFEGPGGDTLSSIILYAGDEDQRLIQSWSTKSTVAIDVTLTHAHVDEMSHMQDPEGIWGSISTVIAPAPYGSLHIVTRGAGDAIFTADLWHRCGNNGGDSPMYGHFSDWRKRSDRDDDWYDREAALRTVQQQQYYAPSTAEEALAGDASSQYIPIDRWDALYDAELPPLVPGSRESLVIAVDAAVTADCFGVTIHSRHPQRHDEACIRKVKRWRPEDFPDGRIDFDEPERYIRWHLQGGCVEGHPPSMPKPGCEHCEKGEWTVPKANIVQVTYDRHQLEDMMQKLRREGLAWVDEFDQGQERLVADAMLFKLAMRGQVTHAGPPPRGYDELREHVNNANAKLVPGEDSKMRIIKKADHRKIDLAVCASMGTKRVLDLNI